MLYREIIAACSEIHTKHINTLCGQNVELLNVKLVVHIVTAGLWRVYMYSRDHHNTTRNRNIAVLCEGHEEPTLGVSYTNGT
jgi:hypothetical protein